MHENIIRFDQFRLQSRSTTPFPCQPWWLCSWKLPRLVYRGRYGWVEGQDSSVGIATRYGLDGSGTESRWGARSSAPIQTGLGAYPASYTMGTGSLPGEKRQGRGVDHPPPPSAEVKERAEPYLYSPSGPSWPVLGRTFYLYVFLRVGICRLVSHDQWFSH
jgi:hypothetical protein